MYLASQIIATIGLIVLFSSYFMKKINKLLIVQILSNILFSISYFLIGGISALFVHLFDMIRDIFYYKSDNDHIIYIFSIPAFIIIAVISYSNIISIFPILASIVDGYGLSKGRKTTLLTSVLTYIIWFIYDYSLNAYMCIAADTILIITVIILFINHKDIKKSF